MVLFILYVLFDAFLGVLDLLVAGGFIRRGNGCEGEDEKD
jgi:hypothetical protein